MPGNQIRYIYLKENNCNYYLLELGVFSVSDRRSKSFKNNLKDCDSIVREAGYKTSRKKKIN